MTTGAEILAIEMIDGNDAGAETIRDYLVALVREVWREGEGFSGKRPFGNSGWDWDLYMALAKAGLLASTDEWQCISMSERAKGNEMIFSAIEALRV